MIKYLKPNLEDIKYMQELVQPEVEKGIILYRSDNELATNIRSYTIVKDNEKIIGFSALHIHTNSLAEIRSLIIKDSYQGRGIGRGLINTLIEEAKELKVKKVFTLTFQKEFFKKLGFKEIPKENLPEQKIWADCIRCKHFPICNEISLIKVI